MTNCKNCGAPLTNGKCEYCGTEYEITKETFYSDRGIEIEIENIFNPNLPLTLYERREALKKRGVNKNDI